MNWRTSRHELKPLASWFEICNFMNWIACSLNAVGNSCTRGAIHGVSQFMPAGQFIVLQEIIKNAPKIGAFVVFDRRSKVSLGVLRVPFDFVRYREYREYANIKCCTKFAPKSHQHSTPIKLDKLEFDHLSFIGILLSFASRNQHFFYLCCWFSLISLLKYA